MDKKTIAHLIELKLRRQAEDDFYTFVQQAWHIVEPGAKFQGGWALKAICEHLEEVYYGRIKRLLINQPPRTGKSSLISVLWPVWCWIKNPSEQFMCISYAESLAKRDNVKARRLIKSKWFQVRWPPLVLTDDQDTKNYVENTLGGHRYVTGCDGSVTGFGANIIICDDLNSVRDSSETMLESATSFFTDVLPTRFNDFKTGKMVVVQQRTDTRDISGWILANQKKEWVTLILPMEFEESRHCATVPLKSTNGGPWHDPRTEEGELLWPERFGQKELKLLKSALGGEYSISGQLQQRPAPSEGGMIKRAWWQLWQQEYPPNIRFTMQAWDTAMSIKDKAAYSACLTFGIFKDDHQHDSLILLSAWRKRVEFPELYKAVQRMAKDYRATKEDSIINQRYAPDLVLVEEKASGVQLIQTLNKTGITLVGWRPDRYGDKVERVRRVTHLLESGRIYVPCKAPDFLKPKQYADFLISQAALFPKGDGADLVDCFTMILQRCINSGWILHSLEQSAAQENEWKREHYETEGKALY